MLGDRPDLQDLAENPPEVLDVELKDWIDIANDRVAQANIARHLAALANHGGGYLLFGFHDYRRPNPALPFPLETFERDTISAIVQRCLTATFQCEVDFITSRAGNTHPVSLRTAQYPYAPRQMDPTTRMGVLKASRWQPTTPGPKSIRITAPEQWGPLVRKCIVQERIT